MLHTLLCRDEDTWIVLRRDHPTVSWYMVRKEPAGRFREVVHAAFDLDPLTHNRTFSERQHDVVVANLAEGPDDIPHADRSLRITVYTREGRIEDITDRWATLQRSPREVSLWSHGMSGVFQPRGLRQEITRFFGFDQPDDKVWKSFVGGKHGIARLPYLRELWVRPAWRARELAPNDFPAFRPGPVITPEQQAQRLAKLPMNRSAAKRVKRAEAHARIRAQAEERRIIREQAQQEAP